MESHEVIDRLGSLMKLDHDAAQAYKKAVGRVRSGDVQGALRQFGEDHERHVRALCEAIRREGGVPSELSEAVRGVFLEGMTAVEGAINERAVLAACETGEKYVNYKYRQAANEDFPARVMVLIERHCADERRHLSFIEGRLAAAAAAAWGMGKKIGALVLGLATGAVIGRQIVSR
jgi:hypothetical protein